MDGILNIDKPWGKTSFSIVSMVKRLSGEKRVGHAGTLDPAATGVLPVCLGRGTRVTRFLMNSTKAYRAEIELGVETDTYDASGKVIKKGDPSGISREQVESALVSFRGLIRQTPPMYSAVKHQGQPLYKLARAGIQIERESRPVEIYHLEITGWRPPIVTIEVECGKGTYIRSLAHDLGQSLGCGASLKNLIRLRCGIFDIKDAVRIPQLEDAFRHGYWEQFVYPIDTVLSHWRAVVVDDATRDIISKGGSVALENNDINQDDHAGADRLTIYPAENRCRVYTLDGHFLSVLRFNAETGRWQPEKVFLQG
jgi:tRNA pseudouridine55 synthase